MFTTNVAIYYQYLKEQIELLCLETCVSVNMSAILSHVCLDIFAKMQF